MVSGPPRAVLTVSALNAILRAHLEPAFAGVWVEGELSNLRTPSSGHSYFTLKDAASQLKVVVFRSVARTLKFALKDGACLICRGRVTVYEPKGEYQLVVEYAEPKGIGALQLAFEQLKERLTAEGLFDPKRKRALPLFPRRIGVVTSSTGAAFRDIVQVVHKRFPNVEILLNPVAVQGPEAAGEIARAIRELNDIDGVDVLIVGRGGGSLEDLWPFNEEGVARAIVLSRIPVVSAVGHETDYTIADFVADVRAPTPSAAAELVVRDRQDLLKRLQGFWNRAVQAVRVRIRDCRARVESERRALLGPAARIQRAMQRRDDLEIRLRKAWTARIGEGRTALQALRHDLLLKNPLQRIRQALAMLPHLHSRLRQQMQVILELCRRSLQESMVGLHSRSPLAVLARGYSITRRWPDMMLVRRASDVAEGEAVHVRLSAGELICEVRRVTEEPLIRRTEGV
ncbi:MAG: exodeoxyribonuclease VII large subunit [Nitrospirae bacterium]|nr:MAG: exodeoxyribonuclease VII large subunit [Nitrospirota bacterium]